jgi:hypothetical protein
VAGKSVISEEKEKPTQTKRPLSPTSTLSSVSDREHSPITTKEESNKRVKFSESGAEAQESSATSELKVANDEPDQARYTSANATKTDKEQSKMSSDGEDFEYDDDTGFGDDVDMGGELLSGITRPVPDASFHSFGYVRAG